MSKIGENSSNFKIWESPEEINCKKFGQSDSEIEKRKNLESEKKLQKIKNLHRSNSKDLLSTKTPENTKIPEMPKAPSKLRSKRLSKIDGIPKRLQFVESENENIESLDSGLGIEIETHRYPTRSKLQSQSEKDNDKKTESKKLNEKKNKSKKNIIDKENVCNVAKKSQKQISNRKVLSKITNNLGSSTNFLETPEAPKNESLKRQLSNCESADWKDHLRWLQKRRDVGIWIECCNKKCGKWRYVEYYHDPVDVPKLWYCDMNNDKEFANCDVPQQEIPPEVNEGLIMNAYNAGSIVWARLNGYPWWPSMVDDCPKFLRYYQTRGTSKIPHKYNVIFFNKNNETSWVPIKDIKAYAKNPRSTFVKKTKFGQKDYTKELDAACESANEALPLSISERLKNYSFVSQISKDNFESASKKKREASKDETIRIKSRIININADIENFSKFSLKNGEKKIVQNENLPENEIVRNENLSQDKILEKNIDCITIDEEKEISFETNEIIEEENSEENIREIDNRNSRNENVPTRLLALFAEFDALKEQRLASINKDSSGSINNHNSQKSVNNRVKISMEIESESPNSFTAEEFMPRPSIRNLRLDEYSPNSSKFQANRRESSMENRESIFSNRNSSIGFNADEFEPRNRTNFSHNSFFDFSQSYKKK